MNCSAGSIGHSQIEVSTVSSTAQRALQLMPEEQVFYKVPGPSLRCCYPMRAQKHAFSVATHPFGTASHLRFEQSLPSFIILTQSIGF